MRNRDRNMNKQFVELFSINEDGDTTAKHDMTSNSIAQERDLNEEEEDILKTFKENDQELEKITKTIVDELKKVKANTENIEAGVDKQGELLAGLNQRAEKNSANL